MIIIAVILTPPWAWLLPSSAPSAASSSSTGAGRWLGVAAIIVGGLVVLAGLLDSRTSGSCVHRDAGRDADVPRADRYGPAERADDAVPGDAYVAIGRACLTLGGGTLYVRAADVVLGVLAMVRPGGLVGLGGVVEVVSLASRTSCARGPLGGDSCLCSSCRHLHAPASYSRHSTVLVLPRPAGPHPTGTGHGPVASAVISTPAVVLDAAEPVRRRDEARRTPGSNMVLAGIAGPCSPRAGTRPSWCWYWLRARRDRRWRSIGGAAVTAALVLSWV